MLILDSTNSYWGAEISLLSFLDGISPKCYSLLIRKEPGDFEKFLAEKKIHYRKIPMELSPKKIRFYSCLMLIIRLVKSEKHKIVYCNNEDLSTLIAFMRVITFFKTKTFIHIRNIPRKYDYFVKFMFIHTKVISNSYYTQSCLFNSLKNKPKNGTVIYNAHGYNLDNIKLKKIKRDKIILLTVGRIVPWKAQLEMISIINEAKLFDRVDKYLIVGDLKNADPNYRALIKDYIVQNNLESKVDLIAFTKNIETYYQRSSISLICSKHEPFGRTVIEAGIWGLPVIVRNSGALCENIEHKHNGLIWDGDSNQLANHIETLIEDHTLRDFLGKNLMVDVLNKFSNEKYVNNLLTTFATMEVR